VLIDRRNLLPKKHPSLTFWDKDVIIGIAPWEDCNICGWSPDIGYSVNEPEVQILQFIAMEIHRLRHAVLGEFKK